MGRIRTIKPEFPQSETIGKLSRDARLLFIQLWTIVDDAGRVRGASRMLASLLYPYDDDAPSLIENWMGELAAAGHIHRYEVEGAKYLEIENWQKHQKIERPSSSRLPDRTGGLAKAQPPITEASPKPHRKVTEPPPKPPEEPPKPQEPLTDPSMTDLGPRTVDQDLGVEGASSESETRGHTGARKLAVGRAKRLSPDWEPSQRNLADAAKFGLSEDEVPTHVLGFKDWAASSPKACKLDWDATWRTWVRRVVHERNTRPAKQIHGAQADFKILPVPPKKKVVKYDTSTFDERTWAPHLKAYKHDGVWDTEALGPDPESIGCRVPREVREANGFRRPPITVNMNNGQKPQVWPTAPPAKVVPDINPEEFPQ